MTNVNDVKQVMLQVAVERFSQEGSLLGVAGDTVWIGIRWAIPMSLVPCGDECEFSNCEGYRWSFSGNSMPVEQLAQMSGIKLYGSATTLHQED